MLFVDCTYGLFCVSFYNQLWAGKKLLTVSKTRLKRRRKERKERKENKDFKENHMYTFKMNRK
jgi:hypothetical protein